MTTQELQIAKLERELTRSNKTWRIDQEAKDSAHRKGKSVMRRRIRLLQDEYEIVCEFEGYDYLLEDA